MRVATVLTVDRRIELYLGGVTDLPLAEGEHVDGELVLFDPDYAFAVFPVTGRSETGVSLGLPVRGPFYPPQRRRRAAA